MFDCIVYTILANVLTWEFETTGLACLQRNSKMHKVNVSLCVVSEVFDESVEIMSLGHCESTLLIIALTKVISLNHLR